jgi:hypothetical protein
VTPRRRLMRRRPDKAAVAPARAEARSEPPAHGLLRLQQTAGNRAVSRLIQRQRRGPHLLEEGLTLDPEIELEMRKRGLLPGMSEESKAPNLFDPKAIEKALKPAPEWTPLPEHAPKEPEPIVPRGKGPETPRKGGAGDVWDAVKGIPMVKKGLDKVEEEAKRRWRKARGK